MEENAAGQHQGHVKLPGEADIKIDYSMMK